MENPKALSEMLKQAKEIEKNNFSNMENGTSLSMLVNSNDLASPKDKQLANRINDLNSKIEDINQLTQDLLEELSRKNN